MRLADAYLHPDCDEISFWTLRDLNELDVSIQLISTMTRVNCANRSKYCCYVLGNILTSAVSFHDHWVTVRDVKSLLYLTEDD